jgi:putative resolvase
MNFKSAKETKQLLGVTSQTLYNWRKNNKIVFEALNSRNFIYDIDSIKNNTTKRKSVIYARVSNTKQKEDLNHQIQVLREYCVKNGIKVDEVYQEIASGMNESRKKFNQLIDDVVNGHIKTIYISYKDRLSRFGYGYFETLFEKFGCTIECLGSTDEKTYEQELTEDLISIIHHFSMKMYSKRRNKLKQAEALLKSE